MVDIPSIEIQKYRDITPEEWRKCLLGHALKRVPGFGPAFLWDGEARPGSSHWAPANERGITLTIPTSMNLIMEIEQIVNRNGSVFEFAPNPIIKRFAHDFWDRLDENSYTTVRIIGMAAPSMQGGALWLKKYFHRIAVLISLIEPSDPTLRTQVFGESSDRYACFNFSDMAGASLERLLRPILTGIVALQMGHISPAGFLPSLMPRSPSPIRPSLTAPGPKRETIVYHCAWGLGRTGMILCCYALFDYYLEMYRNHRDLLAEYILEYTRISEGLPGLYPGAVPRESILLHTGHTISAMPGTALAIRRVRSAEGKWIPACEVPEQVYALEMLETWILLSLGLCLNTFQRVLSLPLRSNPMSPERILNTGSSSNPVNPGRPPTPASPASPVNPGRPPTPASPAGQPAKPLIPIRPPKGRLPPIGKR